MRKLCALALAAGLLTGALAMPSAAASQAQQDSTLFAGGGTNLSNGFFYPGGYTLVAGQEISFGPPLPVIEGQNVLFVTSDAAAVTNCHRIIADDWIKKRGRKKPMFISPELCGPGQVEMKTSHLKLGVYSYNCPFHAGMVGRLEVIEQP